MIGEDLYQQFCRSMPLACVDLLVVDPSGRVLLLRRRNDPASGQWWFPGGRVFRLETRREAALRKLREECGMSAIAAEELGTFDVILDNPEKGYQVHGITTVFVVHVDGAAPIRLDPQSADHAWRTAEEWRQGELHEFIRMGLSLLEEKQR